MLLRAIFCMMLPAYLSIPAAGAAEETAGGGGRKPDREPVTLRIGASMGIPGFELRNHRFADRSLRYLRDQVLYAGAAVYYRGAGAGARVGVCDTKQPARHAATDFEVQAGYFHRTFGVEAYYRQSGRYHIARSPFGTGALWNRAGAGSRIRSEGAGANLFLFLKDLLTLNREYSYGTAYRQTDKPAGSSGSFMILAGADYFRLRGPVPLIPVYDRYLLMGLNLFGMTGWRFIGGFFGVGFACTLVLPRDFFIAPLIALAVHPFRMEFFTPSGTKRDIRIDSMQGKGRICAGYNGERFFAGLSAAVEAELDPAERFHTVIWSVDLNVELFAGVRI